MKCLPAAKVAGTKGNVLHDWHAEVLAIRAFNHCLLQECDRMIADPRESSRLLRWRKPADGRGVNVNQPFAICDDIKIHMYCSEVPCGDASIELVMKAQADDTPWSVSESVPGSDVPAHLKGHESFSELGIVRRKPARGDSPSTLSKSCSDKLALKQCYSLLNAATSLLIPPNNAYISTLILPRPQYVPSACRRAFGPDGRMAPMVTESWPGDYSYHAFQICATDIDFAFSRGIASMLDEHPKGSNISAIWTPNVQETIINGVIQGRSWTDPQGASLVSKRRMWDLALRVLMQIEGVLPFGADQHVQKILEDRRRVKGDITLGALRGWILNHDDGFKRPALNWR
ncbi:MAG: hypothetical protein Q9191_005288 [Dirinaria sp. TL-2023a]